MKKNRQQRKGLGLDQLINLLREAGLDTHPTFAAAIQEAMLTQNTTALEYLIQDQMPAIQQCMMQMQYEAQKAEADPFYPRPAIEEFSGDIPIAMIPDILEPNPPSAFIMDIGDLMQHTFFCGSPGTGKTRSILSMIRSLKAAMGDKLTIWIFEPKKGFRRFLYPDFKIFTFQDMRDNLFLPPTEKMQHFIWRRIISQLMGAEQQFKIASKNQLIFTLDEFEKKGIHYPTNSQILEKCRKDVQKAKSFRVSDPINSLINRFIGLTEYDSHSRNVHVPIKDLMHTDMVIEIGDANAENDNFRAAMLISRLYYYKKHNRPIVPQDRHYNLIIMDEGRELFNQTSTGFGESELERMFALAREMDIGFIISTQEPRSVSTAIKANVHTMISFPLSDGKERKDISLSLSLNPLQRDYYQRLSASGHGHAIVKYGGLPTAFHIQFPDVPDPTHTVTQQDIDYHNTEFLSKYRIPDPTVPPEPPEPPPPLISYEEELLMHTIHDNPLLCVTEIYDACGLNRKNANEIKSGLLKKGYIEEDQFKIKKNSGATKFMRLTSEARDQLGIKANAWNKPGITHQVYCHLVKRKLENEGWTCELEGQTKGHPHRMDVLAKKDNVKHDYEITISLKNVRDNINKAIMHGTVDKVIIVAQQKDIERCRTKTALEQKRYGDALEFKPISEFYLE